MNRRWNAEQALRNILQFTKDRSDSESNDQIFGDVTMNREEENLPVDEESENDIDFLWRKIMTVMGMKPNQIQCHPTT